MIDVIKCNYFWNLHFRNSLSFRSVCVCVCNFSCHSDSLVPYHFVVIAVFFFVVIFFSLFIFNNVHTAHIHSSCKKKNNTFYLRSFFIFSFCLLDWSSCFSLHTVGTRRNTRSDENLLFRNNRCGIGGFHVIALLLLGQALLNHEPNLSPYKTCWNLVSTRFLLTISIKYCCFHYAISFRRLLVVAFSRSHGNDRQFYGNYWQLFKWISMLEETEAVTKAVETIISCIVESANCAVCDCSEVSTPKVSRWSPILIEALVGESKAHKSLNHVKEITLKSMNKFDSVRCTLCTKLYNQMIKSRTGWLRSSNRIGRFNDENYFSFFLITNWNQPLFFSIHIFVLFIQPNSHHVL